MASDSPDTTIQTTKPKASPEEGIDTPIQVLPEGFTVLADGESPIADVVFIHGLQGHPKRTWTFEATSNIRWNSAFRKKENKVVGVYWPQDLLKKDFHNVRILTYGYDSHLGSFKSAANTAGIADHGQNLLNSLEVIRRENPKRRLIFVAHSLGGLIVKEALRRSRGEGAPWKEIYVSTYALIFFGTPHRGSAYAQLGTVCEAAANVLINTNKILLRELQQGSAFLKILREEFSRMTHEQYLSVHCFKEDKPLSNFKGFSKLVVDPDSACLEDGRSTYSTINANHRAMCRFSSELDPGYLAFKGVISRYLNNLEELKVLENNKIDETRKLRLDECLQSLCTPAMFERREQIEKAEKHTFEWIFEGETGFEPWLAGKGQLFWIKGKPGSGKSTLLKYLSDHGDTQRILKQQWPAFADTAAFYFYDQGTRPSQKSFDGLLHGILHQILSKEQELFDAVSSTYELARNSGGWKRSELLRAFTALAEQRNVQGCMCLFVDALDEYGGSPWKINRELRELLELFRCSSFFIKICASSRPISEFETLFEDSPGLSIHDWTVDDMREVVTRRLREAKREPMPLLMDSILQDAKGVFLWVKLIMEALSPLIYDRESDEELILVFSELPKDLEAFYAHVMESVARPRRSKITHLLQMLLCDVGRIQSLTLAELSLAVIDLKVEGQQIDLNPSADLERCVGMEKRIKTCLGGILEVTPNGDRFSWERGTLPPEWTFKPLTVSEYEFTRQNVQFSHRTAKEYFVKRLNSDFFEPCLARNNLLEGHERLIHLYMTLARGDKGMFYLLNRASIRPNLSLDICETQLVERFAFHSREVESIQYMASQGQTPNRNDPWNLDEFELVRIAASKTTSRSKLAGSSGSSGEPDKMRVRRMEIFCQILGKDPEWLEWSVVGSNLRYPSCVLTFAIAHGLYLYARDIIDGFEERTVNRYDPPLLYWVLASYEVALSFSPNDLNEDEAERSYKFVHYLLERGADPNAIFMVPYYQIDKKLENCHSGDAAVTLIHYALGAMINCQPLGVSFIATLHNINILLEYGSTFNTPLYHNYWKRRQNRALNRSPIQLLIDCVFKITEDDSDTPDDDTPSLISRVLGEEQAKLVADTIKAGAGLHIDYFTSGEIGRLLCKTAKVFLDHGADPNAVDDYGIDVLSSIMVACPYDVIEYVLEKGAQISTILLEKDGSPVRAYGILWEDRWRRPECYTPQAREKVRKHMPHWEIPVDERPAEDEPTQEEVVEVVSGDEG